MSRVSYDVKTIIHTNGDIHQELYETFEGNVRKINHWIVETREGQVRQALITLGWKPPEETE